MQKAIMALPIAARQRVLTAPDAAEGPERAAVEAAEAAWDGAKAKLATAADAADVARLEAVRIDFF